MKLVLLEVSHWHAPLYPDAIAAAGDGVVAVSDRNGAVAEAVARPLGALAYDDWRQLLAKERPDFAFAFGKHCEMAAIGEALVERGIPFVMEKPCGLNASEVRHLRDLAKERKLFVGVPLVQGFGPLADLLREAERNPGPRHVWFRFIAGPPSRYPAAGCAWMLDPDQSGGAAS